MPISPNKLQSWQIFHAARKHLGVERLVAMFGKKNARSIYTWAADPACTEERCKDPLEALHAMLSELDTIGRGDVARSALAYLATALDGEHEEPAVAEIRPTIEAEVLADYQSVAALQSAIEAGMSIATVDSMRLAAVEEVSRTFAKYVADFERQGAA